MVDYVVKENGGDTSMGMMMGILFIVVIGIVARIAYANGWFGNAAQKSQGTNIEVNLPSTDNVADKVNPDRN